MNGQTLKNKGHAIYITFLASIVVLIAFSLLFKGYSYYHLSLEERSFHLQHQDLKPSGLIGHGLGIAGTLLILVGVFSYMARKKLRILSRVGILSNWLDFHIFLCTLGPILILYHTAFKFGGIVAVSFWSMVAVVVSGVIGRFIYLYIPRTIQGRELSRSEINDLRLDFLDLLKNNYHIDQNLTDLVTSSLPAADFQQRTLIGRIIHYNHWNRIQLKKIKSGLRKHNIVSRDRKRIISLCKKEFDLNKKLDLLNSMQDIFKYWHVIHLPFAFIMLFIMIIHVAVAVTFGYRWIF